MRFSFFALQAAPPVLRIPLACGCRHVGSDAEDGTAVRAVDGNGSMRRLTAALLCGLFVALLHGCQSPGSKQNSVEVIIDGNGQFPDFLVGTWKADTGGWEFVFEPNGVISSAVVSLGRVRLKPGQVTTVPMQSGGKGVFAPGLWAVQYSHQQRELLVEITIKRFRVELGDNVLRGKTHDIFVGSISGDGRLWWAERFSRPQYIADTKKFRNRKLTVEPSDRSVEGLLFRKVDESP